MNPRIRLLRKSMKNLGFAILIFFAACKERNQIEPIRQGDTTPPRETAPPRKVGILVKIFSRQATPVDSCVAVSFSLESDPKYNELLSRYICNNLYSNDTTECDTDLVQRSSFIKMILLFYGDSDRLDKISFYDDKQKLVELRENLLFGLRHCPLRELHLIADTLLKEGYFDGLEVLWDKADVKRLPSLMSYLKRVDTGNFFVYADLAAFFHNNGNIRLRNIYMDKPKKMTEFKNEYNSLDVLMLKNRTFDIVTYKETVYGSM